MKRITRWIIAAPSLVIILGAFLCILSTWSARTFLTRGINLLTHPNNSEYVVRDSEIQPNVQQLKNISQELKDRLVKIRIDLRSSLEKIEALRTKITGWITWLLIGIFLVMFWVAGGQIYLLRHFWKMRPIHSD